MPAIRFSSVDLPVPLEPIRERKSPSSNDSETLSSGVMVSPPLWKCLLTRWISTRDMKVHPGGGDWLAGRRVGLNGLWNRLLE